jgi:membrane-bound ClpP family serine protease
LQTVEVPGTGPSLHSPNQVSTMIILGIILLVVGFLLKIHIIWIIGIVVLVIGLVLLALGSMGRAVGGRRHYY